LTTSTREAVTAGGLAAAAGEGLRTALGLGDAALGLADGALGLADAAAGAGGRVGAEVGLGASVGAGAGVGGLGADWHPTLLTSSVAASHARR
jgi:hypothetical protein